MIVIKNSIFKLNISSFAQNNAALAYLWLCQGIGQKTATKSLGLLPHILQVFVKKERWIHTIGLVLSTAQPSQVQLSLLSKSFIPVFYVF